MGSLPDSVKQALILRRQQNIVTAQIAGTNWGKGLDQDTRRAIAEWSARVGIDPATELNVLGGNFYKNAYYYLRRLSEFVERRIVIYAYADHVEVDSRLVTMTQRTDVPELAAEARKEIDRRTMMRIQYNIPDPAKGATVFHLKLTNTPYEFTAAKWCGGGTRQKDPVGDEFPVETSETRAIRRTMRLVATHNPQFRALVEPNDDDQVNLEISGTLRDGIARAHEDMRQTVLQQMGQPLLSAPPDDPYGVAGKAARVPGTMEWEGVKIPIERPTVVDAEPAKRSAAIRPDVDAGPGGQVPGDTTAPPADDFSDLDLLSPDERRDHEERKRLGRS